MCKIFRDVRSNAHPFFFVGGKMLSLSFGSDFTHELTDLGEIDDQNLSTDRRLAALLRPMKYIFTTEIMLHLKGKDDEFLKLDQVDIVAWMTYILKVRTDIEREDIKSVMEHLPALAKVNS